MCSAKIKKHMAKQRSKPTIIKKIEDDIIVINPFEIEKKIRKSLPPPAQTHKSKIKYNRKSKHPKKFDD